MMGVDVGCFIAVGAASVAVFSPVTGMDDGGEAEILQAIIASIARRGSAIQRGEFLVFINYLQSVHHVFAELLRVLVDNIFRRYHPG
jgi:hypothetical protein